MKKNKGKLESIKTIRFPKGNKIHYRQDMCPHDGLPSDVEFVVEKCNQERAVLSAPGYGGIPYGNGRIYIYRSFNLESILQGMK